MATHHVDAKFNPYSEPTPASDIPNPYQTTAPTVNSYAHQQSYTSNRPGETSVYNPPAVQVQPSAVQPMLVTAGGNRNVKNLPILVDGREWSNGLCDCCDDCGTCIVAWCCPCVIYAQNKNRLNYLNQHNRPDPEVGGDFCSGTCWGHACLNMLCGLSWALQISTRSTMRSRYNIRGGGCRDCMTAFCCTPCELTQEHRELLLEEESFPGYKA